MTQHPYVFHEYPKWIRAGANEKLVHSQEEEDAVISEWTAPPQPILVDADADNALKRGPGRPRKAPSEDPS